MEVIKCKGLNFTYPNRKEKALSDISFEIRDGEFCLVLGESGAGKSTLLKLIKKEIAPFGEKEGDLTVNGSVGYVSQNVEESIVSNKVRSELSFGLMNLGMGGDEIELLVAETASYFNFEEKLDSDISTLSGGEKQMVNLAAVMILKPDILVLDEPCSALDPVSTVRFCEMIQRLHRDFSTTVLLSDHSAEELFDAADSVMLLDNAALLIKDHKAQALQYMKEQRHPMLGAVPKKYVYTDISAKQRPSDEETSVFTAPVALKIKNLYFAYEREKRILNGLSLNVYQGKINAVVGPNSSGKTTLLKTIAGVNRKNSGKMKADGSISMLSQNVYDLFTKEKCEDEVTFGEWTEVLGISDLRLCHPYDLSGGQAQRLALAKVLERGADILLLDEPTRGLDCVLKKKLAQLLNDLCRQGKTVLLVSHDIDFVGEYADCVSFLSRGRIITTAPRKTFFSSLHFYTTSLARLTKGQVIAEVDMNEN